MPDLFRKKPKKMPDPAKKETGAYVTHQVLQKDRIQDSTGVALPCDDNVKGARDWVNHNKK